VLAVPPSEKFSPPVGWDVVLPKPVRPPDDPPKKLDVVAPSGWVVVAPPNDGNPVVVV
jgi:hypothetical protein